MKSIRRALSAVAVAVSFTTLACGSDSPTETTVNPIIGLTATAKSATSIQVTFNGTAGDASYDIERAEGSTGTFAAATTVTAPSGGGAVSYTDNSLKANTVYRYRTYVNRGTQRSVASGRAYSP